MVTNLGMNQLTPEQRLAEIAACLAQGIVDLHKQGRIGTSVKSFRLTCRLRLTSVRTQGSL